MAPADGSEGANPRHLEETLISPAGDVDSLLVETLLHLLVEKGVVTKNDALGVVQTAAQVTRGIELEGRLPKERTRANLQMLRRLYASFEALEERPGVLQAEGENVQWLRPPLHGERPHFPRDD